MLSCHCKSFNLLSFKFTWYALSLKKMCSLSHIDSSKAVPKMVDVTSKKPTVRTAHAQVRP
jgi:hypothetical protein